MCCGSFGQHAPVHGPGGGAVISYFLLCQPRVADTYSLYFQLSPKGISHGNNLMTP